MLLMIVIFGKFGSFFLGGGGGGGGGVWGGGGGWGGGGVGGVVTGRPLYSIFKQLFTVTSRQGALYLVMRNTELLLIIFNVVLLVVVTFISGFF